MIYAASLRGALFATKPKEEGRGQDKTPITFSDHKSDWCLILTPSPSGELSLKQVCPRMRKALIRATLHKTMI